MGSLSTAFSRGRGPRPRSNGAKSGPLRRIIREHTVNGVRFEVLECGHEDRQKHDLMGPTNALRRRCRKCKAGAAPEYDNRGEEFQRWAREWQERHDQHQKSIEQTNGSAEPKKE